MIKKYMNIVIKRYNTDLYDDVLGLIKYDDALYFSDTLNEGLLYAYNAKSCERFLKTEFPNIVSVHNYNTGISEKIPKGFGCEDYKNMHIEFAVLIEKRYDNIKEITKRIYNLCGWYPYVIRVAFKDYKKNNIPISVYISYSDFFDESKWEIIFKVYMEHYEMLSMEIYYLAKHNYMGFGLGNINYFHGDALYHSTIANKVNKIAKQGLCPKKKDNDGLMIDCIYFSDRIDALFPMFNEKNKKFRVLLRFNGDVINGLDCQNDLKHAHAFYTHQNISPNEIQLYTDNGWAPIVKCLNEPVNMKTMDEIIEDFHNNNKRLLDK